jgi:uncharacterized membrane protein YagU involved in acid resistance
MMQSAHIGKTIGSGVAAGLAGTCAMMAMRSFDERYAPETIARMKQDPGAYMVRAVERAAPASPTLPEPVVKTTAMAASAGYGTLFGVLYALARGRRRRGSALGEGMLLGLIVYAAGYLGWLPALGLTKPPWRQKFPEVAGEVLRHTVYGVATAAAFSVIRSLGGWRD